MVAYDAGAVSLGMDYSVSTNLNFIMMTTTTFKKRYLIVFFRVMYLKHLISVENIVNFATAAGAN